MSSGGRREVPAEDPINLLRQTAIRLYSAWVSKTYPFASKARNLSIHYGCNLSRSHAPRMRLGNNVSVGKDALLRVEAPLGQEGDPLLMIDENCIIGPRCHLSAKNSIHLEREIVFGPSVLVQDHSHQYRDVDTAIPLQGTTEGGRIRIGEGCWIGQGAVVLCDQGELVLGRNCLIAPNTFVNRSFPSHSYIAGDPARVVTQFDPAKGRWVLGSCRDT